MILAGSIISFAFIALAAVLLFKKYHPQGVLLILGLLMLFSSLFLKPEPIILPASTGFLGFDLFKLIKQSFSETNAGVGLMIMAIGGFVSYIDKIGASRALVFVAMKPLALFKARPYLAASLVIPIGQVLFIAIPSAAGLSLLLMASLFPILVNLGVSRLSAASVIAATTAFGIGPASATTASASQIVNMEIVEFFVNYELKLVVPLCLLTAVVFYFVNSYFDKKHSHQKTSIQTDEKAVNVPLVYALIPILPIVLLIVFSDLLNLFGTPIKLDTTTAMFISLFITLIFEWVRKKDLKAVFGSLTTFWDGMGNIFKTVVTLIIAADIFAKGLISLGFIEGLLLFSQSLGFNAVGIGVVMTIMIFLASMLMGSGNAAFFAFGPLVPNIASKLGVSSASMILPMEISASMGRTVSPVSGIIVAVSDLAGVTPLQIVKRNLIPMLAALVFMLTYHFI